MKIRNHILIFLFAFMISCKPARETGRVEFAIRNECFNDIFVSFVNTETEDSDNIKIIRHELFTIYDLTLSPYKHTNWFTDFDVHINSITNIGGDTINFDPNDPNNNWTMQESELFTDYRLTIDESDF